MTTSSNIKATGDNLNRCYLGGTWDLLHPGHIELFKRAKELGTVIVSLNTDEFAESYKRKPIMTLAERKAMIEACRYVDEVVINTGGADSKPAIIAAKADIIIHGSDWVGDSLLTQMGLTRDWLEENNIKLVILQYTAGVSTTDLIKRKA